MKIDRARSPQLPVALWSPLNLTSTAMENIVLTARSLAIVAIVTIVAIAAIVVRAIVVTVTAR